MRDRVRMLYKDDKYAAMVEMAPPGSHIFHDKSNGRWRFSYGSSPRESVSWKSRGHRTAMIEMLQRLYALACLEGDVVEPPFDFEELPVDDEGAAK